MFQFSELKKLGSVVGWLPGSSTGLPESSGSYHSLSVRHSNAMGLPNWLRERLSSHCAVPVEHRLNQKHIPDRVPSSDSIMRTYEAERRSQRKVHSSTNVMESASLSSTLNGTQGENRTGSIFELRTQSQPNVTTGSSQQTQGQHQLAWTSSSPTKKYGSSTLNSSMGGATGVQEGTYTLGGPEDGGARDAGDLAVDPCSPLDDLLTNTERLGAGWGKKTSYKGGRPGSRQ